MISVTEAGIATDASDEHSQEGTPADRRDRGRDRHRRQHRAAVEGTDADLVTEAGIATDASDEQP